MTTEEAGNPTLFLITAREGSKGIPGKNVRPLGGKPLVCHAIDQALAVAAPGDTVCLSTDSEKIREAGMTSGIEVPFLRPAELASDTASSYDVIIHALDFYSAHGLEFGKVVLLQPTSPLRETDDIRRAIELWSSDIDMVVSVCESKSNPYYNEFEADEQGMLRISKGDGHYTRRQDAPKVYEYNGAVYVMSVKSLRECPMSGFTRRIPYEMPQSRSLDLDTEFDWIMAEAMMRKDL